MKKLDAIPPSCLIMDGLGLDGMGGIFSGTVWTAEGGLAPHSIFPFASYLEGEGGKEN